MKFLYKQFPKNINSCQKNDASRREMDLYPHDGFEFATAGSPRGFSGLKQKISSVWGSHTTEKSKPGIQTHFNCKLSVLHVELLFLRLTFTKEQEELGFSCWDFPVLLSQMGDPSRASGFHGLQVKSFDPTRRLKPWPGVIGSYSKKLQQKIPRWNSLILSSFWFWHLGIFIFFPLSSEIYHFKTYIQNLHI